MAVPNTDSFSLQDVENEIAGTQGSLTALFAASNEALFDPAYKGSKNSLMNFRNYNSVTYGFLYNLAAILHANFPIPGWHIPSSGEWNALIADLGGSTVSGGHLKEMGLISWDTPNTGADNSSGLSFRGGGTRDVSIFSGLRLSGVFAAIDQDSASFQRMLTLSYNSANAGINTFPKTAYTVSVRLFKDDGTNPGSVTDIDGNIYNTIKIGGQVITGKNFKCTKLNNGTAIPNITNQTTWNNNMQIAPSLCAYNNDINNV